MNVFIKSINNSLIIILFTLFLSCNNNGISNDKTNNHVTNENIQNNTNKNIKLDIKIQGENKTEFIIGKKFTFLIEQKDTTQFDSVQFFINNQFLLINLPEKPNRQFLHDHQLQLPNDCVFVETP